MTKRSKLSLYLATDWVSPDWTGIPIKFVKTKSWIKLPKCPAPKWLKAKKVTPNCENTPRKRIIKSL